MLMAKLSVLCMRKISRRYLISWLGLVLVSAAVGSFIGRPINDPLNPSEVKLLIGLTPQVARQRTISRILTQPDLRIGGLGDTVLLAPTTVKARHDGSFYVLDWGDRSVKEFGPDGLLRGKYGKGVGSGPGEMLNPTDFDVMADGGVIVCDPVNGRIDVFQRGGSLLQSSRLPVVAYRIALIHRDTLVLIPSPIGEYLFRAVTLSGAIVGSFGRMLESQIQHGVLLDGYIASGIAGDFVYVSLYGGILVRLELSGKVRFARETIDGATFPKLLSMKKGDSHIVRVDPSTPWSQLSVSVGDGKIFVLVYRALDRSGGRVIDVYNLDTGDYMQSIGIRDDCKSAFVTSSYVFAANDTSVSRWPR